MKALLVRVAVDQSDEGGGWNGPADSRSGEFAYVCIPEGKPNHPGLERPYSALSPVLAKFGVEMPVNLRARHMHLDPDFEHLTYGDAGHRGAQIRKQLSKGDIIAFYGALCDVRARRPLIYAMIGLFVVDEIICATKIPEANRDINAHSRRILALDADDVVVRARHGMSGRFKRYLLIGEWRDRAYRVRPDILEVWGGLSVKNGYLQRSGTLPHFVDPLRFWRWFERQNAALLQTNN